MKLQARFLLVYTFLFFGATAFLLVQRALDLERSHTVLKHELATREAYFNKIYTLDGHGLQSYSDDYSFWDDMVTFVHHPTTLWSSENIDSSLGTYGADAAWVYNTNDQLVYYSSASGDKSAAYINLPASAFQKLFTDRKEHFYVREPGGLMEIRAATIVPSDDQAQKTTPQGFWLVGRYIGASYVSNMATLTQSAIKLASRTASTAVQETSDTVTFGSKLDDWQGKPLAVLTLTAQVPVEADLENLYNRQLILLLIFFIASMIMIAGSIWQFVLRPVKLISSAISQHTATGIAGLAQQATEFGSLAQTVQLSFAQQQKIEESEFLKKKLEELNQAKSEFLAIAAHELKGPIGNVYIFAGYLSELIDKTKTTKAQLQAEVERISQQARKATVLINDIYQASKGGQALEFVKTEFEFDPFIRREVENAQYSTGQKLIVEGETGQRVTSDQDRLGQVMANLIRNASKYSGPDEKIIIRLSHVDNAVQVEVQDFGLGIDAEDQPKLFQRFFRSSRVLKGYPGLGLGLSICKEIVEALGGHMWLESALGHGSRFYFQLPVSTSSRVLP
jgi:signal transduction histidine kinase